MPVIPYWQSLALGRLLGLHYPKRCVIGESFYWKADLPKQAEVGKKRVGQKCWPDASLPRGKQTIMLGSYSVWRLAESAKPTDHVGYKSFERSRKSMKLVKLSRKQEGDSMFRKLGEKLEAVAKRRLNDDLEMSLFFIHLEHLWTHYCRPN